MALTKVIPGMIEGSVSGGANNLIDDGDAESGTVTNYIEGSYAAATRPAGTFTASSGAGTFAISNSATAPLFGDRSFIVTKSSGASRQGRAIERTITIDSGYQASVMDVFFQYKVDSGTFVAGSTGPSATDSSMIVYFAVSPDGTTWTIKEPSSFRLLSNSTTIMDTMVGSVQTEADTTHVKVIMYVAETTNSAWSLKCELGVRPTQYVYGTPITDWTSYTPTGSWVSNTNYSGKWRRVGDSAEIQAQLNLIGVPTATQLTISYPSGLSADPTKLPSGTNDPGSTVLGTGGSLRTAVSNQVLFARYNGSSNFAVIAQTASGTYATDTGVTSTVPVSWNSGDVLYFNLKVPIVGWSSSVQMSDNGGETRVVAFVGSGAGGAVTANVTNIPVTTTKDTHAGWSGSVYTVQVAGDYIVGGYIEGPSTSTLFWYKNGSSQGTVVSLLGGAVGASFAYIFNDLKTGDQISFRNNVSQTLTAFRLSLSRISGPSAIAASETVAAYYATGAGQTITTGGSPQIIDFGTKNFDTHNAVTTGASWKFTAPTSGIYEMSAIVLINSGGGWNAGEEATLLIYKNNVSDRNIGSVIAQATHSTFVAVTTANAPIRLVAGDYIDLRIFQSSGGSVTLNANVVWNWINIKRIGL